MGDRAEWAVPKRMPTAPPGDSDGGRRIAKRISSPWNVGLDLPKAAARAAKEDCA